MILIGHDFLLVEQTRCTCRWSNQDSDNFFAILLCFLKRSGYLAYSMTLLQNSFLIMLLGDWACCMHWSTRVTGLWSQHKVMSFFPPFWMGNTRWCKLLRPVWKLAFYICLYCNLYLICIWLLKNHSPLIAGELAHALRFLASVVSQSFLAFGDILELHRKFLELSGGVNRMFELEEFLDAAQNGGSSLHCLLFYCWSPFCCLILFLQVCKTLKLFFPISLLYVNLVWNM